VNYGGLDSTRKSDLTARYEALRAHVLGDCSAVGNGFGLALFKAQGMTAWMIVFLTGKIKQSDSTPKITGRDETVNSTLQASSMIAIMTDMVISQIDKAM
jgi:hypothetical protein